MKNWIESFFGRIVKPSFDHILVYILVRFTLNLVELGQIVLFCSLLCLKCARSSFEDKSPDFDR